MRLRRNSQEVQNTLRTVSENYSETRSQITSIFVIFLGKIERISLGNRGFLTGGVGLLTRHNRQDLANPHIDPGFRDQPSVGREAFSTIFPVILTERLSAEVLDSVAEKLHSSSFFAKRMSCPGRMLRSEEESFGVRHQPQNAACFVTKTGDVGGGAIGVVGSGEEGLAEGLSRNVITQSDLLIGLPVIDHAAVADGDPSFGVGNREFQFIEALQKDVL